MAYDFIVFGGTGLQGRICARDLLNSGYSVLLAGRDSSGIKDLLKNKKAEFMRIDLQNQEDIINAIRSSKAKIVINCAEFKFNLSIMRACLKAKKSCTDLGGLQKVTKEQFRLNSLFKKNGILCITGCGSTPGISNVMAAYAVNKFDSVETILLGFAWNSNKKVFVVPYSMESIFDEFTQPPIIFYNGKFKKENKVRCKGTFNFQAVGKQTVYCIVHSEVYSFSRYFRNKGLKNIYYMAGFPEHSMKFITELMDSEFSYSDVAKENKIKSIDFVTRILKQIPTPAGYKEVENIWVKIEGIKNGKKVKSEMNCITKTIKGWESAGSNINTGRTISIISQMLLRKKIQAKGVHAPESIVPQQDFFRELAKRRIFVYENGKKLLINQSL
ncbi:MAG: saccharopine dehydrogenase C-terminal domain-containing protein [Nanoarchaeota archaeon]